MLLFLTIVLRIIIDLCQKLVAFSTKIRAIEVFKKFFSSSLQNNVIWQSFLRNFVCRKANFIGDNTNQFFLKSIRLSLTVIYFHSLKQLGNTIKCLNNISIWSLPMVDISSLKVNFAFIVIMIFDKYSSVWHLENKILPIYSILTMTYSTTVRTISMCLSHPISYAILTSKAFMLINMFVISLHFTDN